MDKESKFRSARTPRITPKEHYRRHVVLNILWQDHAQLFGVLPPHKQWQLHRYYQPTASLTEAALLTHRTTASKRKPALPREAGKGFLELERHYKLALRLAEETGQDVTICLAQVILRAAKTYPGVVTKTQSQSSTPSSHTNRTPQTTTPPRPQASSRRPLRAVGVARPEPDIDKLASALLEMAKELLVGQPHLGDGGWWGLMGRVDRGAAASR